MAKIYAEDLSKTFDTDNLGTVALEGQTLYLTQQAYADNGCDGDVVYRAHAIDVKGNLYNVTWTAYDTDAENECYVDSEGETVGSADDESNACDWEKYQVSKY